MENIEFKIDQENVEQQKAFDLVAYTNTSLFITGKAGTGKTTFIKGIQEIVDKNFIVLAPTGIAAMNVGGQTIHSFFGLPFEAIGPDTELEVSREKREVLKHTDTIIIDEASMVRCDWVDGIDRFLRSLTKTHLPFGGKQMLFVGDLFQLPPVVVYGSATADMLQDMYGSGTPYFYKANVMKRMNLPKIEFQKVYRQKDLRFLNILDRMRLGENTNEDLEMLNGQVSSNDKVGDFAVILTAYVKMADGINEKKLDDIESEEFCYQGDIEGDFRIQDTPVPMELRLKVGAQVMFTRNDVNHRWVNGTLGTVVELNSKEIKVKIGEAIHDIGCVVWESYEYEFDKENQEGAITIHKSQGMTFDRMHFDLTRGTFAPGQAYVAISRMRSLDGLTLSNKIRHHHIMQNTEIKAFANSFNDIPLIDDELNHGRLLYKHLQNKDYDSASKECLQWSLEKMKACDYRNAALLAKKMFDVMLDDKCLKGLTKEVPLLKDCSMTCNFLNAVICLYSDRLEEAIGYANMVLDRRPCIEAMFIKGKALQSLNRYEEAWEVARQIRTAGEQSDDKITIDKKQYLFEAELNAEFGNPNIDTCKQLLKLCPEYIPAYIMLRREVIKEEIAIEQEEEDEENPLISAFNDTAVSEGDFKEMLEKSDKTSPAFIQFAIKAKNITVGC